MSINTQSLGGFPEEVGAYMATISALSLTQGTNFFYGFVLNDADKIADELYMLNAGYTPLALQHVHVNWSLRFVTTRKTRDAALDALQPVVDELKREKRKRLTNFTILTVRELQAPEVTQRLPNGRFLAEATLQFQVIPKG